MFITVVDSLKENQYIVPFTDTLTDILNIVRSNLSVKTAMIRLYISGLEL